MLTLQKYDVERKSPAAKNAQAASEDWCPVYKSLKRPGNPSSVVFFVVKKLKNSKCTLEMAVRHWNKTLSSVFLNYVCFCFKSVSPN